MQPNNDLLPSLPPLATTKPNHINLHECGWGIRWVIRRGSKGDPVLSQGILFYGMLGNNTSGQGDPIQELTLSIILKRMKKHAQGSVGAPASKMSRGSRILPRPCSPFAVPPSPCPHPPPRLLTPSPLACIPGSFDAAPFLPITNTAGCQIQPNWITVWFRQSGKVN